MGKPHGAALAAVLALSLLGVAPSDDGRPRDVRAVRSAAQTLLRARVQKWGGDPARIAVEGVAVDGAYAIARWRAGNLRGAEGFYYIWDRWWDVMASGNGTNTSVWWTCSTPLACNFPTNRSAGYQAFKDAGFPQAIVEKAVAVEILTDDRDRKYGYWSGEHYPILTTIGPAGGRANTSRDGYDVTWSFGPTDATATQPFHLGARRPAQQESWTYYPGGNAYAFLTVQLDTTAPLNVRAGSTVDVWCPFVLDPSKTYSLTIAKSTQPVGPIVAKLNDNVLHFELPAFTVPPGAELMAEIDGTL